MRTSSQDDYLIKIIQQMVQMLLRITGLKQAGKLEEALDEVDRASRVLLGSAADVVLLLDPFTAAQVIGDPDRVLTWAKLLAEEAEIHQLRGSTTEAERARERALALARESLRLGVPDSVAAESLVEALRPEG